MNRAAIFLVVAGILSMLVGCNEDKETTPEVVQSVEWYKAHKPERDVVLAKCRSNPGQIGATPNCINASRAESATTWGAKGSGIKTPAPLTADDIKNKN